MKYREEDYLQLSGIQHFVFCRRQWALIHIEEQWEENLRTTEGRILHERVHNPDIREKRGNIRTVRAMKVFSSELGISGECDVVEFVRDDNGVALFGAEEKYRAVPIEYKRGKPKEDECDILQLTAQALCLEEMLCCTIQEGYLFYGETKHRLRVAFDKTVRERTESVISEMHMMYERRYTPKVKRKTACNACSLKHICLPGLEKTKSVNAYLNEMFYGEESD